MAPAAGHAFNPFVCSTQPTRMSQAPEVSKPFVVIVGAGFAGIGAAIALKKAGVDFVILEKAPEIGGVWRDNHYPDCGCDVPSALYSYSFAPNPHWSRFFAKQEEIKQYTHETVRRFDLLPHLRLNTELLQAQWQSQDKCWRLLTSQGDMQAPFVVMACGPMHVPIIPRIPGLDGFEGVRFHSSQWDHGLDLQGLRVAVIGSGASAIQFVPKIQPLVQRLTLFQRTPPWVLPKMDGPISARWQGAFKRLPLLQKALRQVLYLQFELLNSGLNHRFVLRRLERLGLKNIQRGIQDPQLQARVRPDFSIGCKRILLSNTWYRALAKPNVEVFGGIDRIQGKTLVDSQGQSCEVDAIVFATGFEVANPPMAQRIVGKSGTSLAAQWQGSPKAYLGTMAHDCPNLFLTFGPNLYSFTSAFVTLEAQLRFIVSAIKTARKDKLVSIAVHPQRLAQFNQALQTSLQTTVWNSGCSSYFLDKNGRNSSNWPWTTFRMRRQLSRFVPADFVLERAP